MDYFSYVKLTKSPDFIMEVFNTVADLESYAKTIYKGLYEEVLDKAFFHILDNFDPSKGQLENYAVSVVGKILLNKYRREVTHDLALDIALEDKSAEEDNGEILSQFISATEERERNDVKACTQELVPYFIKDARFFATMKSTNRTLSYSEIFSKYSTVTIKRAVDYLSENYLEEVKNFYEYGKSISVKRYSKDRYKKSLDTAVNFKGEIGGIVLYEKLRGFHDKFFYSIDLKQTLVKFISKFYYNMDNINNYVKVEEVEAFISILGEVVVGVKEVSEVIEKEMLGMLVSRNSSLKVVKYDERERLIVSCTSDLGFSIAITAFGESFSMDLKRLSSKQV